MDSLLNRYRSIILLLVVLVGQLIFLAYQVKTDNDVRVIRVWAVTVITPIAQIAENTRSVIFGIFHNYFDLHNARSENRDLHSNIDKLKLENQYLRSQLSTADRVQALAAFTKESPSRYVAARIVGTATTSANKIVFLDRGSNAEVEKGMAVITPDGIVGKILDAYPTASQALLATDPGFAAGVVSQKNHVRGILRGIGSGKCKVDLVQNEEKVDVGEMFYTSGDDRIFPSGMPVGKAAVVRDGPQFKDILVYPIGLQNGPEEVLIVLNGVHQAIPEAPAEGTDQGQETVYLGTLPPQPKTATDAKPAVTTTADKVFDHYRDIGAMEGHKFGEGSVPNFNVAQPPKPAAAPPADSSVAAKTAIQTAAGSRTAKPALPPSTAVIPLAQQHRTATPKPTIAKPLATDESVPPAASAPAPQTAEPQN